ncbi:MAG: hypothetical protein ACOC1F_13370, partial [Myxococcota bacterium]
NPAWANVEHWVRLWTMARTTARWRDKIAIWFKPPEWRPDDLGGVVIIPEVDHDMRVKYEATAPRGAHAYVGLHFVIVAAAISMALWLQDKASMSLLASLVGWIVVSLVAWGGLFERKRWAAWLEAGRLAAMPALVFWVSGSAGPGSWGAIAAAVVGLVSIGWVVRTTRRSEPGAQLLANRVG